MVAWQMERQDACGPNVADANIANKGGGSSYLKI